MECLLYVFISMLVSSWVSSLVRAPLDLDLAKRFKAKIFHPCPEFFSLQQGPSFYMKRIPSKMWIDCAIQYATFVHTESQNSRH